MSLPVLVAAPAMSAHQIRRASNADLGAARERPNAFLQPRAPHRFELCCSGDLHVEVGASRFTVVALRRHAAYRIVSTPQLAQLERVAALEVADDLDARLRSAGFLASEQLDRQRSERLAAEHDQVRLAAYAAPALGSGMWRAEIWLRTVLRQATRLAGLLRVHTDACLITFVVEDASLRPGIEP